MVNSLQHLIINKTYYIRNTLCVCFSRSFWKRKGGHTLYKLDCSYNMRLHRTTKRITFFEGLLRLRNCEPIIFLLLQSIAGTTKTASEVSYS